MTEDFVPASDVIGHIPLLRMRDGYTPVDMVALIKTVAPDGTIAWVTRQSQNLHSVEAVGALHAASILYDRDIVDLYTPDDEEG